MQFPVYLEIAGVRLHPHWVFEMLAYAVAFQIYFFLRRRRGDSVSDGVRWSVIAAATMGAAIGSKMLFWFEEPLLTWQEWRNPAFLLGGKSIVGALAGGLIAVELLKRHLGVREHTGDLFAVPLCFGIAVGRIGCFLTGLADHTYGGPTSLPWGVDFGDRVARHPAQLYELVFMILLGILLQFFVFPRTQNTDIQSRWRSGDAFKLFMVAYMGFRLLLDWLKPEVRVALGLSSIQWVCLLLLLFYSRDILRWCSGKKAALVPALPTGSS
jgi:phosphatidylglycerol---prolipoprotein diacylglyceryl transferase